MADELKRDILSALAHRQKHGGHVHTSACIHNLPPEEQIAVRRRTVEWWQAMGWPMPEQITPEQWEADPPDLRYDPRVSRSPGEREEGADRG